MRERRIDLDYVSPDQRCGIRWSREDDVVFCVVIGTWNSVDADLYISKLEEWLTRIGHPYALVMDVNEIVRLEPAARQKITKATIGEASPLRCYAVVGGNFAVRAIFNIYARLATVPMKMFSTEPEALAWIHER